MTALFILYTTHKGKRADAVIKHAQDKAPCSCIWKKESEHLDLMQAIIARSQWLKENKIS